MPIPSIDQPESDPQICIQVPSDGTKVIHCDPCWQTIPVYHQLTYPLPFRGPLRWVCTSAIQRPDFQTWAEISTAGDTDPKALMWRGIADWAWIGCKATDSPMATLCKPHRHANPLMASRGRGARLTSFMVIVPAKTVMAHLVALLPPTTPTLGTKWIWTEVIATCIMEAATATTTPSTSIALPRRRPRWSPMNS